MPELPIRNNIRQCRQNCGDMTQQELAKKVGVTRQTINAIELGKYSPSLEVAFRIVTVFGKTIDEVFVFNQ